MHGNQSQAYAGFLTFAMRRIWPALQIFFSWCGAVNFKFKKDFSPDRVIITQTGHLAEIQFSGFLQLLQKNQTLRTETGMDLNQEFLMEKRPWWGDSREAAWSAFYRESLARKFYRQGMLNVASAIYLCKWHGKYVHKMVECARHPSLGTLQDTLYTYQKRKKC